MIVQTPSAIWCLTEAALIEERSDGIYLWGRWDTRFGHWRQADDGLVVCAPARILFNRLGVWFEPDGPRNEAWYQSRAAIAAYFSPIPTAFRRIAAGSADPWQALLTLWRDPGLARTVEETTISAV